MGAGTRLCLCLSAAALRPGLCRPGAAGAYSPPLVAAAGHPPPGSAGGGADDRRLHHLLLALPRRRANPRCAGNRAWGATHPDVDAAGAARERVARGRAAVGVGWPDAGGAR